jgi:hypothetical protein
MKTLTSVRQEFLPASTEEQIRSGLREAGAWGLSPQRGNPVGGKMTNRTSYDIRDLLQPAHRQLRTSAPACWRRHPLPIRAYFEHSLVLTYAFPRAVLEPLLPPGLALDAYGEFGFVAIAMVQAKDLRLAFLPRMAGMDSFMTGYRIFARYKTEAGRTLRGLRILRSDTNKRWMAFFGNVLTHYNYQLAQSTVCASADRLEIQIETPQAVANLHVLADLSTPCPEPPPGSPFADQRQARLFAGPLPFTFDYEQETNSIVLIEGVRSNWRPRLVHVKILQANFLAQPPFNQTTPILANAFYVADIPYEWKRGRRETLTRRPCDQYPTQ